MIDLIALPFLLLHLPFVKPIEGVSVIAKLFEILFSKVMSQGLKSWSGFFEYFKSKMLLIYVEVTCYEKILYLPFVLLLCFEHCLDHQFNSFFLRFTRVTIQVDILHQSKAPRHRNM
jgi:hypothetical protein